MKYTQLKINQITIILIVLSLLYFSKSGYIKPLVERTELPKNRLITTSSIDTLGAKYRIEYWSNDSIYVINYEQDTLIAEKETGLTGRFDFEDFNRDGYLDIRYGYVSNYFYETIWLHNPETNAFQKIEGISNTDYAYSEKIEGTKFYHSYSPVGCGKANWISYLFILDDYRIIPIASMYFKQCVEDDKGIYVYILKEEKKILKEKLPIIEIEKQETAFYRYYWRKEIEKNKFKNQ